MRVQLFAMLGFSLSVLHGVAIAADRPAAPSLLVVIVVDSSGEVLPGAVVTIQQGQEAQSKETGPNGLARFRLPSSKKINVVVTQAGFTTARRDKVSLERNGTTVIGLSLRLPEHCDPKVQICM